MGIITSAPQAALAATTDVTGFSCYQKNHEEAGNLWKPITSISFPVKETSRKGISGGVTLD